MDPSIWIERGSVSVAANDGGLPSGFFSIQLPTQRAITEYVDRREARTAETTMDKSLPGYSL
jgi:hypothetical protein